MSILSQISEAEISFQKRSDKKGTAIEVPVNLRAFAFDESVGLIWEPIGASGATYDVYIGPAPDGEDLENPIAVGLTGFRYAAVGLTNGQTYYFRVRARVGQRQSRLSNEAYATPLEGLGDGSGFENPNFGAGNILAPDGLNAESGNESIYLNWQSSPYIGARYNVFVLRDGRYNIIANERKLGDRR